jgi:hypothetical protein
MIDKDAIPSPGMVSGFNRDNEQTLLAGIPIRLGYASWVTSVSGAANRDSCLAGQLNWAWILLPAPTKHVAIPSNLISMLFV